MYEGEGLGRLIIDLDAVLGEAASMMEARDQTASTSSAATRSTVHRRRPSCS